MARENQSLQIGLIVSVMLTIILGVTTFVFYREYDQADTKAKAKEKEYIDASNNLRTKTDENNRLKKVIGFPETEDMQAIDPQINQDMQTYAAAFPEDTRVYRQVAGQLFKTLQEKNAALAASQAELQTLKDEYKAREAGKDSQIKDFEKAREQASQDLAEERKKFNGERDRLTTEGSDLKNQLQKSRKDAEAALAKIQADLQNLDKEYTKQRGQLVNAAEKLEAVTKETFEVPDGEITWVDQRARTVWINVGRADALGRQTTFSVYSPDAIDVTKAGKKASIEITQIVGDHVAQAQILEDRPTDPITAGDKIFTPLWSPGQQRHFALAGVMDIYGDGKNEQKLVHDLIVINGGVVDCEADAKGEIQGQITVNTRYLVVGDEPNIGKSKEVPQSVAANTAIHREADKYRLQKIKLHDLLQQMGWKNQTPVVRYGTGANPRDFRAKPDSRVSGRSDELFKPRNPPRSGATEAY